MAYFLHFWLLHCLPDVSVFLIDVSDLIGGPGNMAWAFKSRAYKRVRHFGFPPTALLFAPVGVRNPITSSTR